MKLVPTYRLLLFVGVIVLPLTLLLPAVDAAIAPAIALAAAVAGVAISDAYRSRGRLRGIRIMLPEVVRVSEGREGNFNLQIENEKLTVRRIRLGLAFPEEIYTPAVELTRFHRSPGCSRASGRDVTALIAAIWRRHLSGGCGLSARLPRSIWRFGSIPISMRNAKI